MPGEADRDAGLDPRFDPVFQRGYDPTVHRRAKRPPEPVREPKPAPEAPRAEVAEAVAPVEPVTRRAETPEPEPLPRNPFRLALLLVSIATIVAAGLLLWRRVQEEPYYGGEVVRLFTSQLLDGLMVPLLTGGIVGLCLWLALGAVRGRDDA